MPNLDWIGKKAVVNHHREVPFHLLTCIDDLSAGDPGSGNLLVQGDNLIALKALLPYYAGQVKCIYIDPPYNTGNENWVYNDNVNGPEMREWLGRAVGKEAEDLSRHDKWLCMMYPRLALLREFLRDDGAIFVSIDDNEVQALRYMMDEIFGPHNYVSTVIWQKVYSPKSSARHFSEDHDYIVVYAKKGEVWRPLLVPRTEEQDKRYKNPDNEPRGPWKTSDLSARNAYSLGIYSITGPTGRIISGPPKGMYWRVSEEKFHQMDNDNRIWWGKNGDSIPQIKRFLSEVKQGVVPQTLWPYHDVGHTQEAKKELLAICDFEDSASVFITPKPLRLLRRIIQIAADKDSLILDSFAGSGTTGHAVLAQNAADGGSRRFILVEMENHICRNITAQRLTRVVSGHGTVPALRGGFRYCELGEALFDDRGNIRATVPFADLARHVYFTETGAPLPTVDTPESPLLGVHHGTAVYLLYNGILKDKSLHGGNVLTKALLSQLPRHGGPKVIYGAACKLGAEQRRREGIVFKQLPYKLRTGVL